MVIEQLPGLLDAHGVCVMRVAEVLLRVRGEGITISEVVAILMDQPTRANGGHAESHAHMHMKEGFRLDPDRFGGSQFSFERKKTHWEGDSHLTPSGIGRDFGRYVYESGGTGKNYRAYGGVMQDPDRLPGNLDYANRTGLAQLPEVTKVQYTVYRYPSDKMGAPKSETYSGLVREQVEKLASDTGRSVGKYQPAKGSSGPPKVTEQRIITTPRVPKSPAHSMFPDSESMAMHLCASLNSEVGKRVLAALSGVKPGAQLTMGIFCKSAVRAVQAQDTNIPNQLLERVLEVDQTAPRSSTTGGRYPATGKVLYTAHNINHVVVVLGHRNNGHLNVLTCYPTRMTTQASINTITTRYQDIAELKFGTHTRLTQRDLPPLSW